MDSLTERAVITRAEELAVTDLDGETVVLDVETGTYFGLNEVGTQIFALTEESIPVSNVLDHLKDMYDVPAGRLREDVMAFLHEMYAHGLIRRVDDSLPG
jgi:hypothetical protein